MKRHPSSSLLLFGATGDLAKRMLLPSLYALHEDELIAADLRIVGTARSELSDEEFRTLAKEALDQYLPYLRAKTSHGFLLSTKVTAVKLHRRDMMKMIKNLTEERLGKRIGVQLIRVLRTTGSEEAINKAAKLRRELGHGPQTQLQYISK